jgi:hypothetical protein
MLKGIDLPPVDTGRFGFGGNSTGRRFDQPSDWRAWLAKHFPEAVKDGFASHHEKFWEWLWDIDPDSDPAPFIGIWPRGGGKSTAAELGGAALGMRGRRRYILYIRDTQERADDSVSNIAALLESAGVERQVNKYGQSRGWRRNRLRTADGFTVDALGLDVAGRGVKLENQRPDVIIFDDIDGRHDSQKITEKKIATITDSLLPAGTSNVAVLGIQNLIIPNGIFSRLTDGRADFLSGRIVSGPHSAIRDLVTEKRERPDGSLRDVITGGLASWAGQSLEVCQRLIDRLGLSAFLRECQHNVKDREGALWTQDLLESTRVGIHPRLVRIVVGVDPSGGGDEIGIVVCGKGIDGHAYVLDDRSQPGHLGPANWGREVARAYGDWKADKVIAEKNFGGDMVASNIRNIDRAVAVEMVSASRGKDVRAEPVATLYQENRAHHVGAHEKLETEKRSWAPGDADSPNRMDAEVWAMSKLMLISGAGASSSREMGSVNSGRDDFGEF